MTLSIHHEPNARRFAADVGGKTAYVTYRQRDEHVFQEIAERFGLLLGGLGPQRVGVGLEDLPPRGDEFADHARGGGIASQLTHRALEYAREHGYRVMPSCPFVAAYIERHPEYRELRVEL